MFARRVGCAPCDICRMVMHMTEPNLITSPEAGRIIGRSPRTIHRLVESGALTPAVRLPGPNGALLFRREDIEALAEKRPPQSDTTTAA